MAWLRFSLYARRFNGVLPMRKARADFTSAGAREAREGGSRREANGRQGSLPYSGARLRARSAAALPIFGVVLIFVNARAVNFAAQAENSSRDRERMGIRTLRFPAPAACEGGGQ